MSCHTVTHGGLYGPFLEARARGGSIAVSVPRYYRSRSLANMPPRVRVVCGGGLELHVHHGFPHDNYSLSGA